MKADIRRNAAGMAMRDDLKCPLCFGELTHHPPTGRDFSYSTPYIECGCGFSLKEEKIYFARAGQSAFDADREAFVSANQRLLEKAAKWQPPSYQ